jgi:hypothetical protein
MIGRVLRLAVCAPGRAVASQPVEALTLTAHGIVGDRHAGPTLIAGPRQKGVARGTVLPNTRQVSLVSREESAEIAQRLSLPALDFTWLAANLELEGIPGLTSIAGGKRFAFEGGVRLTLEGENEPCRKVGKVIAAATGLAVESSFVKAAWGRRGLVGWVETGGTIRPGETVRVESDAQE